jgi:endonuclease YncB( thermonuclease family)
MARTRFTPGRLVLLVLIAAVSWYLRDPQRQGKPSYPNWEAPAPSAVPSKPVPATKTGAYETFRGCRFEEHRQNDGDSFRVKLPDGRVEQFRLYFVDCPESAFRSYRGGATNHERIHEQALALGISEQQAVEIGSRAKSRVHDLLDRGGFTLYTRWDDPFGDRRYHAFILAADGKWLDETLVREGLARIHTKGADLPDGTAAKVHQGRLREIEKEARKSRRGAWGMD